MSKRRQNKLDSFNVSSRNIKQWQLTDAWMPLASGEIQADFDIMSLKTWAAFRSPAETQKEETQLLNELNALRQQATMPVKAISKPLAGRNELCPCGSGKKYKKCCLG